MCGRYAQAASIETLAARFQLEPPDFPVPPRYNIAPTQNVPVIMSEDKRRLRLLRWGLIPRWAKDPSIGARMINARAETIREKPSFKTPFERNRCLVPADGFYEWKKESVSGQKTPMLFKLKDGGPFAFAGLFDRWRGPDGKETTSFAIITTTANETVAPIHERMPVILLGKAESAWLDPKTPPDDAMRLLVPYPCEDISVRPVSKTVNSPRNDSPDCLV